MIDLISAAGVLLLLGGVMLIAKYFSKRLTPEGSRKTIHLTMGCAALVLPFVVEHVMTVVFLGIIAVAFLLLMRIHKGLRAGVATALLGVERKSLGDIYFVISIVVVFALHKSTFEYIIPIAILTFADAIAALIGVSYGRYNMAKHDQEAAKSREGSVMFFIVAFICALIPLQLMTEIGRAEVLAISFLIGFLAAIIEAVTRHGNDNLLLPLLTYSFLRENIAQPLENLLINFGVLAVMALVIFAVQKLTNLTTLSIAYSLLVGYVVMVLGGFSWLWIPLILFLTFGIFPMMKAEEKQMTQSYKVIESNSIVGVLCLYVAVFFPQFRELLYISFSLSFAINLAINAYSRMLNFSNRSVKISASVGFIRAVVLIALPTYLIAGMSWITTSLYLVFMVISIVFAVYLNKKYDYKKVGDTTYNANKIMVGGVTAAFTVILGLLGEIFYVVL